MKCLLFGLLLPLLATAANGVDVYPAAKLEQMTRDLSPGSAPYADRALDRYGNHYLLLIKRDKSGSSELHEHEADIFIVQSGKATILTGGKMVNPHSTKAGEIRGSSIQGGERHLLAPGDIIHISAGIPHQILLENGSGSFSYFVVKVTGQ